MPVKYKGNGKDHNSFESLSKQLGEQAVQAVSLEENSTIASPNQDHAHAS